jgi:hypothetical protein
MSIFNAIPIKSQSISKPISNEFWLDQVLTIHILDQVSKEGRLLPFHLISSIYHPKLPIDNKKLNLRQLKIAILNTLESLSQIVPTTMGVCVRTLEKNYTRLRTNAITIYIYSLDFL